MATQAERRALMFLAAVALLGAGTRAWRARHPTVETGDLAQQIEAVDSAKGAAGRAAGGTRRRKGRSRLEAPAQDVAVAPLGPIDLDTAPVDEIEKLPGIGPALAKRIVDDRLAKGPFGCLGALDEVKGIGPAMIRRLDSLATFSGTSRPACVRRDSEAG